MMDEESPDVRAPQPQPTKPYQRDNGLLGGLLGRLQLKLGNLLKIQL